MPVEEQILYWLWYHLNRNKGVGGVNRVQRSRNAACDEADGTLLIIRPQQAVATTALVNSSWTSDGGNASAAWQLEVEFLLSRSCWPDDASETSYAHDATYAGQQMHQYAAESSLGVAVAWMGERLRQEHFTAATGYPDQRGGTGMICGDLISAADLQSIGWSYGERDQGEISVAMNYLIEYRRARH